MPPECGRFGRHNLTERDGLSKPRVAIRSLARGDEVDIDSTRDNERRKGWASLADNIALAFLVAAGAQAYDIEGLDLAVGLAAFLALVSGWVAWHIRGLIEAED